MNAATKPRFLIVDDEENVRFLAGSALQPAGLETAVVESGDAALDTVIRPQPTLRRLAPARHVRTRPTARGQAAKAAGGDGVS